MTFTYQWLRCTTTALTSCTEITGQTATTYVIVAADLDRRLRVRVTASNAGGTGTATSDATAPVRR
jgi:fibronectin-binding autotransporter adhesin